ncbi:MAG TPA: RNA polymerase sigma factor [Acidobacteriota bacterium]|jgi:RNA polymerase sigma-70 factor (ECF subfamily)
MERLERFAQGDVDAFESLFRQFQAPVYGWILRIVRNSASAEDLTVETFWRIYRSRARFDPQRSFEAWARRIATNVALDHLRSARPEVELAADLSNGPMPDPAIQRDLRDKVQTAFRQLPPKFQAVATLALIEELPYEEIAEAFNLSVGGVKSRVFRAVRMLRKKLKRLGYEV